MPAMTPPSSPWTLPSSGWRCWCGCGRTAASTPTRPHGLLAAQADRAGTAPSSTVPIRPPGPPRPPPTSSSTTSTTPSPRMPGRGCIPNSTVTPATAAAGHGRSCAAPSSASRSSACPPARAHRRCCGVVGRPRHLRSRPCLAGVRSPVRPGAHRPVLQADPRLDHAQAAASRAGRPLDLAGAGRLCPAAPGPRGRR
jgi:hypothetical protein